MSKIPVKDVTPKSEAKTADLYQSAAKIYVKEVSGFFQRLRSWSLWVLMIGYFGAVWLKWDGHQAIWFDLPARKFHIFSITFWPQDFILLAWLLIICAFGLFTITTFAGRVWCGYTCPQSAWTFIYMWIEERIEGTRNQRIKLDKQVMNAEKLRKKTIKHILWLLVAVATAITFVGYFYQIRELIHDIATFSIENSFAWFWIAFFTIATYGNAGWMREQVCIHMCPYARFQAVMFDQDTMIVSYDEARGERGTGRGTRKKGVDPVAANIGDCVDCNLCVQVCPTGIDIRDGLQYQCIGCALCIDACDEVMDKMEYPKGLIRYTSEHALQGKETKILRPKLIGYAVALVVMMGLFAFTLFSRVPMEMDVLKDRGTLYTNSSDGRVQNSYTLKIMNMDQKDHEFSVTLEGLDKAELSGDTHFTLKQGEIRTSAAGVKIMPWDLKKSRNDIEFVLTRDDGLTVRSESRFIGPAGG